MRSNTLEMNGLQSSLILKCPRRDLKDRLFDAFGEALVAAMAKGEFHVFPDSMARQIGEAYAGFAAGVIEAAGGEG